MKDLKISRGRTPDGKPNPVDVYVGARVKMRRMILKMSQEKLAEAVGITFQQVQKYERGMNRISASRLYDLSAALNAPISFFFDDMNSDISEQSPRKLADATEYRPISISNDILYQKETTDLLNAYYSVKNRNAARSALNLLKEMSKEEETIHDQF